MYKYFGENLAPSEFKEMLDFIFAINEVQDFLNLEKEKRVVHNEPPHIVRTAQKSTVWYI